MSEPFRITSPWHGDVLNLHDGKETSDQLTVEVAGAAPQGAVHSLGIALGVPTGRPSRLQQPRRISTDQSRRARRKPFGPAFVTRRDIVGAALPTDGREAGRVC